MLASKLTNVRKNIYKYLINHSNINIFIDECKKMSESFRTSPNTSTEFHNSVIKTFELCNVMKISQIFPDVLYLYILDVYTNDIEKKHISESLFYIDFVDSKQ